MRITLNALASSPAFWTAIGLFTAANLWSWQRHRFNPECCDIEATVGFPFPFYISGGISGMSEFYLLGLLLDVAVALTVAVLVARLAMIGRS